MEPYGLDWVNPEGTIYLPTWLVFEGFFDTFGTPPLLGRTFHPEEHERGGGDVVVLGYTLWKTRFAGAEEVVGRVLALDGRPHTVIGVMPEGFAMPSDEAVWAPKVLEGWEERSRTSYFYTVFGRLRTGIGLSEAAADLDTVAALLSREYPRTNAFSVTERLSSAPGVTAAGMTSSVPLMETIGAELAPLTIEGAPPLPAGENPPLVHFTIAAGDLFEAFSIPLLTGRLFDSRDDAASAPVAIVSETFVTRYFPDVDAIGSESCWRGVWPG